jgi:hypothetical protein
MMILTAPRLVALPSGINMEPTRNINQIGRGRALICQCVILVIHAGVDSVATYIEKQIQQLFTEVGDPMHNKYNHGMEMLGNTADPGTIGGVSLVAAVTWLDLSSIGTMITAPLSEAMASRA